MVSNRTRIAVAVLGTLAGVFLLDAAMFRTNFYPSILEPDSTTGLFELILWREKLAQRHYGDNLVATIGDSRVAFLPRTANGLSFPTGYAFRSAGVAGSDPRSQYFMLRDLDPTASRYRAICIGVEDIDDSEINLPDHAEDERSLHYVIKRLRLSDVWSFSRSYHSWPLQWEAFRGALLKGLVYQADIRAFLEHPQKRIDYIHLVHKGYESWTYDYVPEPQSLDGLQIDWIADKVVIPDSFGPDKRETIKYLVSHKPLDHQRLSEYRRVWFGRTCERYRGSRTKIIFFRVPRAPIPFPESWYANARSGTTIRDLAAHQSNVLILNEHTFEFLERPIMFKDAAHLNREGVDLFSLKLSQEVAKMLGPATNAL
jgi:hypothetical protein